jgi:hypothetical protein
MVSSTDASGRFAAIRSPSTSSTRSVPQAGSAGSPSYAIVDDSPARVDEALSILRRREDRSATASTTSRPRRSRCWAATTRRTWAISSSAAARLSSTPTTARCAGWGSLYITAAIGRLGHAYEVQAFFRCALVVRSVPAPARRRPPRLLLQLGAGHQRIEYESYGFAFPKLSARIEALREGVEVIRALWGSDRVAKGTARGTGCRSPPGSRGGTRG